MFKIPEQFEKVVKKMYPEIESLQINQIEVFHSHNLYTVDREDLYKVKLTIYFNDKGPSFFKDIYSEMINKAFVYTYGDSGFVYFDVEEFRLPESKTNRDRFMELFYVPD